MNRGLTSARQGGSRRPSTPPVGVVTAALLALLAVAVPGTADNPRLELVEMRFDGRDHEALGFLLQYREEQPQQARALGFDYAAGRLAELLGRLDSAEEAYAAALDSPRELVPFARYRLALRQHAIGHPEVAAGLAATALGSQPPDSLTEPLTSLLVRSIARGGDCRLLAGLHRQPLPEAIRRRLTLAAARCDSDDGDRRESVTRLLELLAQRTDDVAALEAARLVAAWTSPQSLDATANRRVGTAFHDQREFALALPWLESAVAGSRGNQRAEIRYLLARSRFWRGEYREAAQQFAQAAGEAGSAQDRARALYQRARSLELAGDWRIAAVAFRQVASVDPSSGWAPAGLLSALRLDWRAGREAQALSDLEALRSRRQWQETVDRAALFLAASDIPRGQLARAAGWLDMVAGGDPDVDLQEGYWRARLADSEGHPAAAVVRYSEVLRRGPAHPLAISAKARLARPSLAAAALQEGLRLAATSDRRQLYVAWLLLGNEHSTGVAARRQVEREFQSQRAVAAIGSAQPSPPARWTLWEQRVASPEELLLAIGLWDEGAPAVARRFPLDDPSLALTGIDVLARGERYSDALRRAEILARRMPAAMPVSFYPANLLERLYPLPWSELIGRETTRQELPALLLAAVIREESRFDAQAVSAVGARGLTQFVPETARRLANRAGLPSPQPEDLHEPATAISLGAAYLGELLERFDSQVLAALAAYNAGEDQATLWRSYCFSPDPAEYFTKVGFAETRGYLVKVVGSWARYEEIHEQRPVVLRLDR